MILNYRNLILFSLLFLGGCASVSSVPDYQGVREGAPYALIKNQGALGLSTTTCQLPGADSVCRSQLLLVDEKKVSTVSNEHKVEPGAHRIRLMCTYWQGGPAFFGNMDGAIHDYEVTFESEKTYQVHGQMENGSCLPWLADSLTNQKIGSKIPFKVQNQNNSKQK